MALTMLLGCDPNVFDPSPLDAGAAPNASVVAHPVVTTIAEAPDAGSDAGTPLPKDGGIDAAALRPPQPPQPFRADEVVAAESILPKEFSGVALEGHFSWPALPHPADTPNSDRKIIAALSNELRASWQIELTSAGRMRIDFSGRGLPLARDTTLLARDDRYGHVLLWPGGRRYRVLSPGTLRTVLAEVRADVTPLASPRAEELADAERLGQSVRRYKLASAYGEVTIELAALAEAGAGAPLLCRTLLELGGVAPTAEICEDGVALAASYRWGSAADSPAAMRFEVTSLRKTLSQDGDRFAIVPPLAGRERSGLPGAPLPLSDVELHSLRSADAPAPAPSQSGAPSSGIEAYNGSDQLMWLFIDGLPAAGVAPYQTRTLEGLRNGRYGLQWRTFLADVVGDASEADVPARVTHGVAAVNPDATDAGATLP